MPQSNHKFSKKHRLSNKKTIDELFSKKANSIHGTYLFLKYIESDNSEDIYAKVLIVVPKKLIKKAVDRNKYKRKLREIYRKQIPDLFIYLKSKGIKLSLSIVLKSEINNIDYKELETDLNYILTQLKTKL